MQVVISTQSCLGLGNIRNQGAIKFNSSCTWYAYVGVFASFTACLVSSFT